MHKLTLTCLSGLVLAIPSQAQSNTGDPVGPGVTPASTGDRTAAGGSFVFPSAYATKWGALANAFPFHSANMHYQQVFRGAEASTAGVFTGLALRGDETYTSTAGTWTGSILLGPSTFDENTLGMTFASNFNAGSAPTQVLPPTTVNMPASAPNTNLSNFAIQIPFKNIYVFTPTNNLVVDVTSTGKTISGYFDKVHNDPTATTTRIWATNSSATVAGSKIAHEGLVMCFLTACANASYTTFGAGCQGSGGRTPALGNTGLPKLGGNFSVDVSNALPNSNALLFTGISNTTWAGVNLPFSMAPLGAPGCNILVSLDLRLSLRTNATGTGSVPLAVPNNSAFCGVNLFQQFFVEDANANNLGGVVSNGGSLTAGN